MSAQNHNNNQAAKPVVKRRSAAPSAKANEHANRFSLRLMLATGATVAALVGAPLLLMNGQVPDTDTSGSSAATEAVSTTVSRASQQNIVYIAPTPTAQPVIAPTVVVKAAVVQPAPSTKSSR